MVRNIIDMSRTGYIKLEHLESLLQNIFGVNIKVKRVNDRYIFDADRVVTDVELDTIREDNIL
ncbi:hypothetical protein K505DRAFT_323142 [Melanomma pulvis-pyrius CBS 109.77]|uniref:Uncharacterized protein n=1 Tax=Melanomma pulvis-pyrius CBS 109.77 TaxID=1314802 RepID=A0A6A6XJK4_9PLEO|nr:hypothetical protein K505DRAFT_323142 [Melanomma pulvis-pyrius CBS 109.77]